MNKYLDIIFKLFLLCLGFLDFFNLLPGSFNIIDKLLTAILLFCFWLRLSPTNFIIGTKNKKLDWLILFGFYILVIDTFLPFIEKDISIYSTLISYISLILGTSILIIIAFYFSKKNNIKELSVVYAVTNLIKKTNYLKNNLWLRFFSIFIILFAFSQYLFGLVNQWFMVSLDKSLFIVALIYAIKDLKSEKIKILNILGSFDEFVLSKITELFTTNKLYLGISFLLIFHYLSDIGTFFIPYLFGIEKDPYYFSRLGLENLHLSLIEHFQSESINILTTIIYILSGLGVLFLLIIPILFCCFVVFDVKIGDFINGLKRYILICCIVISILCFLFVPWVNQKAIISSGGIIGVDFLTYKLSSVSFFNFETLFIILILIFVFLLLIRKFRDILISSLFLGSLVFLGIFLWNYIYSIVNYYFNGILFFIESNDYIMVFLLIFLFLLDILFYLGGFFIFTYFSCRYLARNILKDLLNNKLIIIYGFSVVLLAIGIINLINNSIIILFSFLIVSLIFNFVFYRELIGLKEYRDDFILAINAIIFLYLFFGFIGFLLEKYIPFIDQIILILLTIISIYLVRFFKLEFNFIFNLKNILLSLLFGFCLGYVFYIIKEPINFSFIFAPIFIAITEENMFRLILLKLSEKSFSFKKAQILQSLLFASIHFLFLKTIFSYYNDYLFVILYFIALFIFSLFMGYLARKGSIFYPILAHLIANLFLYFI